MAVLAVGGAGLTAGLLGLRLGRPLGEGGGLTFGLPARLVEFGACLGQFALEAFVIQTKAFGFLAKLFELGAQVVEVRQEGGGHGHRIADFD